MKLAIFTASLALIGCPILLAQEESSEGSVDSIGKLDLGDKVEAPDSVKLDPNNAAGAIQGKFGNLIQNKLDNLTLPDSPDAAKGARAPAIELPESVKKLSPAQQIRIQTLLQEAAGFIQGIRLQEGLDRLIEIEKITPDLFQAHNLRGAIYTKLRDFEKARKHFRQALTLEPNLMHAMFNLAELDFVEKKFAEAETGFRKIKEQHAKLLGSGDGIETAKLIDYKLFISVLRQSKAAGDAKEKEALAMLGTFSYLDDWPIYYYSNAALSFHRGKQEEAQSWLGSAENIYSKPVQSIYIDALIEMGWLDSL